MTPPAARGPQAPVLYGMMSCQKQIYADMVEAQLTTWASTVPREAIIVVGGPFDDVAVGVETTAVSWGCSDAMSDVACKEGTMLYRAAIRARRLGSKWFVVSQDDKYIWKGNLERKLSEYDPATPQVFASFGCGRAWRHWPKSRNGTLPRPPGWAEPSFVCDAVWKRGAICGGSTFIMSRSALDLLLLPGQTAEDFHREYLAPKYDKRNPGGSGRASDSFSSCLFYNRSIPMFPEMGLMNGFGSWREKVGPAGVPAAVEEFRKRYAKQLQGNGKRQRTTGMLTVHLAGRKEHIPSIIRQLHTDWPHGEA